VNKELGENCSELSVGLVEKPDCLEIVVISYETWSTIVAQTEHPSHQGRISDSESAKYILITHCGWVTQICIYTLQLCKTNYANLRF